MPPLLPRPFRALALAAGLAFGALTLLSAPAAEAASAKPQGSFLAAQLPGSLATFYPAAKSCLPTPIWRTPSPPTP